jgi:hypothetical protein
MRRVVFAVAAFLVVASCGYRPVYIDRPAVQPGIGASPARTGRLATGQQVRFCREVSRLHCDTATCKGKGIDLVTYSCQGEKTTRCELGKGGC